MAARSRVAPLRAGERLLTPEDVVGRLQLPSRHSLYRLVQKGEAPPLIVISGKYRWREADLDAWIAARAREAA